MPTPENNAGMVKCLDGVVRHWYAAFPRNYTIQFAGIEPGSVNKPETFPYVPKERP